MTLLNDNSTREMIANKIQSTFEQYCFERGVHPSTFYDNVGRFNVNFDDTDLNHVSITFDFKWELDCRLRKSLNEILNGGCE